MKSRSSNDDGGSGKNACIPSVVIAESKEHIAAIRMNRLWTIITKQFVCIIQSTLLYQLKK
jgi:hypothetical protein